MNLKFSSYKEVSFTRVTQIFETTFSNSEGPDEGRIIGNLVTDLINKTPEQDILGFIAKDGDKIIGGVFFTRLIFDYNDFDAFILAPMAIETDYQGKGIGQKLIHHGIQVLQKNHVKLIFTYGDPDFYSKVGFQPVSQEMIKAPFTLTQPEGWLCQSLDGDKIPIISDKPRCVEAFDNPEYW